MVIYRLIETISLTNTSVSPGTYSRVTITVDAQGRVTSAESAASDLPPSYINGLEMTKVDASTISVSDGMAKSSDNTTDMTLIGSRSYESRFYK